MIIKMINSIRATTCLVILAASIMSCSIAPGMHMESNKSWFNDHEYVYIESLDQNLKVIPINEYATKERGYESYKIGIGDQISVTVCVTRYFSNH